LLRWRVRTIEYRFQYSLAYPPWALFPFEVIFKSFLSVRPSFDDALHHRHSTFAYRRIRVHPIFSVRFAPCRVQLLCARDPSFLGNPTYSSSGCSILRCCRAGWSRSRRVLRHCCLGKLRFRRGSLEFAFADDSLTRPPRVVFFRTPSLAFTARCSPEAGKPASRGYHRDRFLTVSYRMTRAHQVVSGGYPDVPSVGEPDGHPSSLRSSWPMDGESSLSGAEVFARVCRSGGIAFHRSSP